MISTDIKSESGDWLMLVPKSWRNQVRTLSGMRWFGIRSRCSADYQEKYPTYRGVNNGFKSFNEFVNWSKDEVGYEEFDSKGRYWVIDKDIISSTQGFHKTYSPETCLLIPHSFNALVCSSKRKVKNTSLPLGVGIDHGRLRVKHAKFQIDYTKRPKDVNLYYGYNIYEAHKAYKLSRLNDFRLLSQWSKLIGHRKLERGINDISNRIEQAIGRRAFILDLYGDLDNTEYCEDLRDLRTT